MYLKFILSFLLFCSLSVSLYAQDEATFIVDGRLTSDDGKTDGASITLFQNGKQSDVVTPPRSGKFYFELEYNHEYSLLFKKPGFFQKIIIISTYVPTAVLEENSKFPPLSFVLNLFKETDIIDQSFTIKPVARVFYNANIDNFDSEIYLSDDQLREQIQAATDAQNMLAAERKSISKADELEQAELEKKYDKLIADGNSFYNKNSYDEAISKFRDALMLFSDRSYPRDRINEIEDLLASLQQEEQLEQNYLAAIQAGDASFNTQQYSNAISSYEKALEYKAKDKYATGRIAESNKLMKSRLSDQQYNDLIAQADVQYNSQLWTAAKDFYQQAIALRPRDSQYARDQVRLIDQTLANQEKQQQLEEQYAAAMAQGEDYFAAATYSNALSSFQQALRLKPADETANARIAATQLALDALANQAKYDELIAKADGFFEKAQLEPAKTSYQQALALKPAESYPQSQLDEINRQLAFNTQLSELLAQANQQYTRKEYPNAKASYQQVLSLVNEHELASNRIAEIDQILAQQDLDQQYQDAIALADASFNAENYADAKTAYHQASGLKPTEEYPKNQIGKIDLALAELAKKAQLDSDYQAAIAEGDRLAQAKNYQPAIVQYENALKIKPKESYPTNQIAQLKDLIAAQMKTEQLERAYAQYISRGDSLFALSDYQASKSNFTDANQLKPQEQYPQDKLAEINGILAELTHQKEVAAEVARAYTAAISRADQAFQQKDFDTAIEGYEEAHLLKQDEQYPITRLEESRQLQAAALAEATRRETEANYRAKITLADNAYQAKEYAQAKSFYQEALTVKADESYPQNQISKIDTLLAQQEELDRQFAATMANAQQALDKDSLPDALTLYQQAQSLKPAEPEPPVKISQLQAMIANRDEAARLAAAAAAEQRAAELALRKKFDTAVAQGDKAMTNKDYTMAQSYFEEAQLLIPEESYPPAKLAEIESLLQQLALAEQERLEKARQDSLNAANLIAYNNKISQAESLIDQQKLADAVVRYEEAIAILPEKQKEVQGKIDELNSLIAQIAQLDADYQAAIAAGDSKFQGEEWEASIGDYQRALTLKPNESYPKNQIDEARLKIREQELLAEQAKAAEKTEAAYNEAIQVADKHFDDQDYSVAQFYYNKALDIQPENAYPKQRLDEISRLIDQSLAADEIKAYNEAIEKADVEFERKGYTLARFYYNKALEIKSWEKYPKDQIKEIAKLTNTMLSQRDEENYIKWINTADEAFVNQDFAVARTYYQRAQSLKKDEPYPSIKLTEIETELEKLQAEASEKEYQVAITQADEAFNGKNYSVARFYYNKALNLKPKEEYPKKQLELIKEAVRGN